MKPISLLLLLSAQSIQGKHCYMHFTSPYFFSSNMLYTAFKLYYCYMYFTSSYFCYLTCYIMPSSYTMIILLFNLQKTYKIGIWKVIHISNIQYAFWYMASIGPAMAQHPIISSNASCTEILLTLAATQGKRYLQAQHIINLLLANSGSYQRKVLEWDSEANRSQESGLSLGWACCRHKGIIFNSL